MLITKTGRQRTYGVEIRAHGPNQEFDGIICGHCDRNAWRHSTASGTKREVHACSMCQKFICDRPECRAECLPFAYRLDQWERRGQGLRYDKRERLFDIFQKAGGRVL